MKYIPIKRSFYYLLLFNCLLMTGTGWSYYQTDPQWWRLGTFLLPLVSFTGLLINRAWSIKSLTITRRS